MADQMKPFTLGADIEALAKSAPTMTLEQLAEYSNWVFRKRSDETSSWPAVDVSKLREHGIPYAIDSGVVLVSSDGMRRAREVGAIKEAGA